MNHPSFIFCQDKLCDCKRSYFNYSKSGEDHEVVDNNGKIIILCDLSVNTRQCKKCFNCHRYIYNKGVYYGFGRFLCFSCVNLSDFFNFLYHKKVIKTAAKKSIYEVKVYDSLYSNYGKMIKKYIDDRECPEFLMDQLSQYLEKVNSMVERVKVCFEK